MLSVRAPVQIVLGTLWRLIGLRFGELRCRAVLGLLATCQLSTEVFACHAAIKAALDAERDPPIDYNDNAFKIPRTHATVLELAAAGLGLREEAGLSAPHAAERPFRFTLGSIGARSNKGSGHLFVRVVYTAPAGRLVHQAERDDAVRLVLLHSRKQTRTRKNPGKKGLTVNNLASDFRERKDDIVLWLAAPHSACSINFKTTTLQVREVCLPAPQLRIL